MVFLATIATIIASQAAITGSFSIARQAVQLGFLPRLKIIHTSELEGQIYVPLINWALAVGVVALVLVFQSSGRARRHLRRRGDRHVRARHDPVPGGRPRAVAHGQVEARAPRGPVLDRRGVVLHLEPDARSATARGSRCRVGLLIAAIVMVTWRQGPRDRDAQPHRGGGPARRVPLPAADARTRRSYRVPERRDLPQPGQARRPRWRCGPTSSTTGCFHEKVLIVSVDTGQRPARRRADQFVAETLGSGLFKIVHVTIRAGYHDTHERARGARAGPQTRAARAQPRPRARLLLRLADDDHADQRTRHAPLAQAAVHRRWPATPPARSTPSGCRSSARPRSAR